MMNNEKVLEVSPGSSSCQDQEHDHDIKTLLEPSGTFHSVDVINTFGTHVLRAVNQTLTGYKTARRTSIKNLVCISVQKALYYTGPEQQRTMLDIQGVNSLRK